MAYCANCGGKLVLSDPLLTKDLLSTDHYLHYCGTCKYYWHLHFLGKKVVLSASDIADVGLKVCSSLVTDLEAKIIELK